MWVCSWTSTVAFSTDSDREPAAPCASTNTVFYPGQLDNSKVL